MRILPINPPRPSIGSRIPREQPPARLLAIGGPLIEARHRRVDIATHPQKGSTATHREAARLLWQHDILPMATWVVGLEEKSDRDFLRGPRQALSYGS